MPSEPSQTPPEPPDADATIDAAGDPSPAAAPPDPQPGDQLGDYEILDELGGGALARVYLAWERPLDRLVALKVSRQSADEGRMLAQVEHAHIVSVYRELELDGRHLLAMQLVVGRPLSEWLLSRQVKSTGWRGQQLLDWLDEQTADLRSRFQLATVDRYDARRARLRETRFLPTMVEMWRDLAEALDHAHSRGVLHRDIKPDNIMLNRQGAALLTDFNVSVRSDGGGGSSGLLGGTLPYMSPEQLRSLERDDMGSADDEAVGQQSDIYSLGVVAYEMIASEHPWPAVAADSRTALARQLLAQRLAEPRVPPALEARSPGLSGILTKCLAPDTKDRYESAADLADDLQRWLEDRPLQHAPDTSPFERAMKFARRHWLAISVSLWLFLLAASLIDGFTGDYRRRARTASILAQAESIVDEDPDTAHRLMGQVDMLRTDVNRLTPYRYTASWTANIQARQLAVQRRLAQWDYQRFTHLADMRRRDLGASKLPRDPLTLYRVLTDPRWEQKLELLDGAQRTRVVEDVTELLFIRARRQYNRDNNLTNALEYMAHLPRRYRDNRVLERLLQRYLSLGSALGALQRRHEFYAYLAGVFEAAAGNHDRAVKLLEYSMTLRSADQPSRFWAKFHHAYCSEQLGRFGEAIASYGACVELRRDFEWTHHNLGMIYLKTREYALAEKSLRRAIELAPKLGSAHAYLGAALHQQKRAPEALKSYDRAIDLGEQTAEVFANRAITKHMLGDTPGAKRDFRRSLEIDPAFSTAKQGLEMLKDDL